jgi:hypothetical protein
VAANPLLRDLAARALVETAVRSAGWTARITALPGLDPAPD